MRYFIGILIFFMFSLCLLADDLPVDKYNRATSIKEILAKNYLSNFNFTCQTYGCYSTKYRYLELRKTGYWEVPPNKFLPETQRGRITHIGLICNSCNRKYLIQIREVYYERGSTKYITLDKPKILTD